MFLNSMNYRSLAGEKGAHLIMGCHEIDGNVLDK
jgi:hypothetical protein